MVIGTLVSVTRLQAQYWRDSEVLWSHAIEVTQNNDIAHANLADLLLRRGRVDEAIAHAQESLRIRPDNSDAENNLALGLFHTGHAREALVHWEKSLELNPDNMNAKGNLAWLLATSPDDSIRDGKAALDLATAVTHRVSRPNPMILRTLGAAYAETGQFDAAIEMAQRALGLAAGQHNDALVNDLQLNIANYRQNLPLRDPGGNAGR
jgi:tetratricopeptide (TPR) repeat protein